VDRRSVLSSVVAAGLPSTLSLVDDRPNPWSSPQIEMSKRSIDSAVTPEAIRNANRVVRERFEDRREVGDGTNTGRRGRQNTLLLPEPLTGPGVETAGYFVNVDSAGRVRYFHATIPTETTETERDGAPIDDATASRAALVDQTHRDMEAFRRSLSATQRSAEVRADCPELASSWFRSFTIPDDWIEEWGCPQVGGRRIVTGHRYDPDPYEYRISGEQRGRLAITEAIFHRVVDGEQWVACLSDCFVNPGASLEGSDWLLESSTARHGWGENGLGRNVETWPRPMWGDTDGAEETIRCPGNGVIEWTCDWEPTPSALSAPACSVAKHANRARPDDPLLRTTATMRVRAPRWWVIPDRTAIVGPTKVEYRYTT
jgi:hypothetical protein